MANQMFEELKQLKEEQGPEAALHELHVLVKLKHFDKKLARKYAEELGLVEPRKKKRIKKPKFWWKPK